MFLIASKYIFSENKILIDKAIAFEKQIVKIDDLENLKKDFPNAEILESRPNTFLMAGLINSHTHLEFSHHTTEYNYGTYMSWLNSVVKNFSNLSEKGSSENMSATLQKMISFGTTTIGAISSQSLDFDVLKKSVIRKIIFNEIIASQPHQVDSLFQLFLGRLEESEKLKDEKLTPAVAIHSPFSVHKIVIKKVLEIAKKNSYLVSAHFMESQAERNWLDNENGEFKDFYEKNYGVAKKFTTAEYFLSQFDDVQTLFTHCNYLNKNELEHISKLNHSISHCPVSNRLLGGKTLDIHNLEKYNIDWNISTDGLSSNNSLNLFDELKIALFVHEHQNVESFAFQLLNSVTKVPAKQLKINSGDIAVGKDSDLILIELKNDFDKVNKIPLHIILNSYSVYNTFIFGEKCF